ncbi:MAG: metallopeptidase TldD-related protein, partial [Planctomycetota bacterium]|nr:metallopeptidase TldD-related protein [Planctomycetota bacterium]
NLTSEDGTKPYFLSYSVSDVASSVIQAKLGAVYADDQRRARVLDLDLRVGSHQLDSSHPIRGRGGFGGRGGFSGFGGGAEIAIDDDPSAVRFALWQATGNAFDNANERYRQVNANLKTMVEEENQAADFSKEEPVRWIEEEISVNLNRNEWASRVQRVSALARSYPLIFSSSVSVVGTAENRYMASSEGTQLRTGRKLLRVVVSAGTRADDGMDLEQSYIFNAASEDRLPTEQEMIVAFRAVLEQVMALREAPLVEPYTGPAILLNRASGVFFHEIFGHRIEGHRQKDVNEGQTFTNMIGEPVLPEFLSVVDDPTQARFEDIDMRGFYRYDDEGVPAQRVELIKDGVLKTFLMSRSPLPGFDHSNGHGRREPGNSVVSRQGNLMVESKKQVPFEGLREMLVAECKKQGKPYGFLFEDISGGFTMTGRGGPQAFKVLPIIVRRIWADGRPDELVRGVDIVGTPLSCFSKIICTGDDTDVFNGTCGAESGWVPVTATSPSILVEEIEIEKRERSQERLPILPSPILDPKN